MSITSDVDVNSLARHDGRHNGAVATCQTDRELGLRVVEF